MATTVISKIVISDDGRAADITGTVAGTAHLWRRADRPFVPKAGVNPPTTMTPQVLAQEFADHYGLVVAASAVLDGVTYTLPIAEGSSTIVFAATTFAEVGYDQLELAATVGGTATKVHMTMEHFISMYRSLPSAELTRQIAQLFYNQSKLDVRSNTSGSDYIASFTTT